jgi:hypothetical protein
MVAVPAQALHLLLLIQAAQATVAGTIRDQDTGEALAGAIVALPDLTRPAVTDAAGRYVLAAVPAGPQHLTVRFLGHAGRTLHALVPSTGRLELDISLPPEPLRLRPIEVRPAVRLRGLEAGDSLPLADRRLSSAALANDPRLAEPDALQAIGGGEVVLRPETPAGVHLYGGGSDQTGYLLDGIPVFSPYHTAGTFAAWNPDALSEVRLTATLPSPADPAALGGTIAAETRAPGTRIRTQGSLSTTQARITLDGPLGVPGAGFLLSLRSGFPGVPSPQRDPTYLRSESGDWLAVVQAAALGGRLRLLGYESENEIGTAASTAGLATQRNRFNWRSASRGAEWTGTRGATSLRISAWSAGVDAASRWSGRSAAGLSANRHDLGLLLAGEREASAGVILAGLRLERTATFYDVAADSAGLSLGTTMLAATGFLRGTRRLDRRTELTVGIAATAGRGLRLAPEARLRWRPAPGIILTGGYARTHQMAQSLRNPESVAGNVFPADLFVGAGAPGVPVARSDLGVLGAEYAPVPGVRVSLEGWARRAAGLALVAPRAGGPFSTGPAATGTLGASGLSVGVTAGTARIGVVADYALQWVRLDWGDSSYVPAQGVAHRVEGGVIVFPTAGTSVRLSASGEFGRRGTVATGGFEWEACNLRDQGCEFGGSPENSPAALATSPLPAYLRIDLGVRKSWRFALAGREATVALFGTATNLLDRRNVLTYTVDPATGARTPVEMRPRAPLLVGLDWRL